MTRIGQGIIVDDESLAMDVIKEVGHGGSYVTEEHTVDNYRKITWFPKLSECGSYAAWTSKGQKDMRTRVHERTQWILANHKPAPLSNEINARLDAVIEKANARINSK